MKAVKEAAQQGDTVEVETVEVKCASVVSCS